MVFSSVIFLSVFLPVVLSVYFFIPPRHRNLFLLVASIFFYAWGEPRFLLVMFWIALLDFFCGLAIGRCRDREDGGDEAAKLRLRRRRKTILVFSIVGNLLTLGLFKYSYFMTDNWNGFVSLLGLTGLTLPYFIHVALPLGISFYTFQSMSYTIDVYRGQVKATRNVVDYLCFVTLFPQLVAGPIVRYAEVAARLTGRMVTVEGFADGVRLFIIGLGKKVIIANVLAAPCDHIFALPLGDLNGGVAWLGAFLFTMQLYFDFAGYSDMAVGLGRMLGFEFPANFNYPYISKTVTEIWTRWHITLSSWLRDYVFVSMGGYKQARLRAYASLFMVFTLCGLWHGANWTFVAFGMLHGSLIVMERMVRANRNWFFNSRLATALYIWPVTLVSMVLFRSDTLSQALAILRAMVGLAPEPAIVHHAVFYLSPEVCLMSVCAVIGSFPWPAMIGAAFDRWAGTAPLLANCTRKVLTIACLAIVFLCCAMKLAAGTHNPFIYFRF